MAWQIFYSDHSEERDTSVSSEHFTPFDIPKERRDNVQVIIQDDDSHKWKTLSGVDYYVWDDRGSGYKWWGVTDIFALKHYLKKAGNKCVLFGTWIENQDFDKIFNIARKMWGEKSTFDRGERKP